MKMFLGALIFMLFALVTMAGAAPGLNGAPPPLVRIADQIVECVHAR